MQSSQASTDALDPAERAALEAAVGSMIPPSGTFGLPGADDAAIFPGILELAGQDAARTRLALKRLDALAGGSFRLAGEEARAAAAKALRAEALDLFMFLVGIAVRCYYRDDRVMRSLGMEPRPPFPRGFELKQGDWSLLEPVRARARIYREAP